MIGNFDNTLCKHLITYFHEWRNPIWILTGELVTSCPLWFYIWEHNGSLFKPIYLYVHRSPHKNDDILLLTFTSNKLKIIFLTKITSSNGTTPIKWVLLSTIGKHMLAHYSLDLYPPFKEKTRAESYARMTPALLDNVKMFETYLKSQWFRWFAFTLYGRHFEIFSCWFVHKCFGPVRNNYKRAVFVGWKLGRYIVELSGFSDFPGEQCVGYCLRLWKDTHFKLSGDKNNDGWEVPFYSSIIFLLSPIVLYTKLFIQSVVKCNQATRICINVESNIAHVTQDVVVISLLVLNNCRVLIPSNVHQFLLN